MYIGVDIGGSTIVAGLTNGKGQLINRVSRLVNKEWTSEALCVQTAQLARQAAEVGGVAPGNVKAVGIGIPGLANNDTGMVLQTPNLPLNNTPLRELFQKEWNVPVYLANDANCAAIGEYLAGAAKGCDPAVVITLGTGLGGGMVVGGKLFKGFANGGMEVGHICIHPNGALCGCGNRGCWEQYGSATGLIRITREEMQRNKKSKLWEYAEDDLHKVSGRTAFQAARQDDESAHKVLYHYLQGLSLGLTNIINVLQPEIICLSGGISGAEDDLLLNPLRKLVEQSCFDKANTPKLVKASLGNEAGIIGAAMLCNML